jgi:hypothetical protein
MKTFSCTHLLVKHALRHRCELMLVPLVVVREEKHE